MNLPLSVNYWAYSAEISDAVGERIVDDRGNFSDKDAERIVSCVNALAGIEDPAGFIKMQRAHIAAQHESLGKCAERIAELVACVEDVLDADGNLYMMDFDRYRRAVK